MLKAVDSKYVVKFIESFAMLDYLYIVMEYCDGGDLSTLIAKKNNVHLNEKEIWRYFIQILEGLDSLHKKKSFTGTSRLKTFNYIKI